MSKPSGAFKNIVSVTDRAVLRERYEFVPAPQDAKDHANNQNDPGVRPSQTWQDRMVQRYHDGLFKEFALADLSRPGQLGLRWRTRQEVVDGRGEHTCGNKRCKNSEDLLTLEVPFSYQEKGEHKKELVKLRLCQSCRPLVKVGGRPEQRSPSRDPNLEQNTSRRTKTKAKKRISRRENDSTDSEQESSDSSDSSPSSRKRNRRNQKRSSRKHKKRRRRYS